MRVITSNLAIAPANVAVNVSSSASLSKCNLLLAFAEISLRQTSSNGRNCASFLLIMIGVAGRAILFASSSLFTKKKQKHQNVVVDTFDDNYDVKSAQTFVRRVT
jgi:predicted flavoprotein YhiN